jgi:hypothetical protein
LLPPAQVLDVALGPLLLQSMSAARATGAAQASLGASAIRTVLWIGGVPAAAAALQTEFGVASFEYEGIVALPVGMSEPLLLLSDLPERCVDDPFQIYYTRCGEPAQRLLGSVLS